MTPAPKVEHDPAITLRILTAARKLLSKPGSWCQDQTQVIQHGEIVKRDLVTAVLAAAQQTGMLTQSSPECKAAYAMLWDVTGGKGIIDFNDHPRTTHAMILFALDSCIYVLQTRPGIKVPDGERIEQPRAVRTFAGQPGNTDGIRVSA